MSLNMKQRFARLDMGKLPSDLKSQFTEIEKATDNFTDEEINAIMEDEFNENYKLVEKYYPGAIRSGGTVVKEKPGKVKVVKAKKEVKEPEKKPEAPAGLRKKLSEKEIDLIEKAIADNPKVSDAVLVTLLLNISSLTEGQAKKWVAKREIIGTVIGTGYDYSSRTAIKKAARKGKDEKTTLDGFTFNQKDPAMKGKKFYDAKGKVYTCKGYNEKSKECTATDEDGKEMDFCLESYYAQNPVTKREKGNLIDDCKDELKKAGYTVKEHKAGTKKIKRSEPRPEKVIIKERVEETFTPIMKDLKGSDAKNAENKEIIAALEDIQVLFTKFMNRISNLADDGKLEAIKKIQKLLKEIVD
jgi:hypothetical protein